MSDEIRLLVVDDEEEFLELVKERLEQRGFRVCTAPNGEAALEVTQQEKFDLALVDLQMPGINGKELLAALKQRHRFLEVIILTGHGSMASAVECGKLGAFSYLSKPYDRDELVRTLKDAYEHRLRQKFEHRMEELDKLNEAAIGESPLAILRRLRELDDEER